MRIAVWPTPISRLGVVRAVLGDPAVVRLEAGVFVIDVAVVAQHHADRRVDHFGGNTVAVLIAEASSRDPSRPDAVPRTVRPWRISSGFLPAAAAVPMLDRVFEAFDVELRRRRRRR